ncbi:MAG TPA: ABC transporter permease [Thermoanaerobaculaceae bacterium]|nr:ABC transporter permease [Thermoanaerobaculaceae bacterium]
MTELAKRDFKARYAGSALGVAWSVLEPLVQFGLYLTVFGIFLGMRLEGRAGVGNFGLYLITGLVPFGAFQESVTRATGLVRERAQLVRHVNVPLEVLLAGTLLAVFARHGIALLLVAAAAAVAGSVTVSGLPWLAVGLVVLVAGVFGLGLALMVAGAFLVDLAQVVGTATMVLFFLTPIVYPASAVPPALARWLTFNPLWGAVRCFRAGLTVETPDAASFAVAAVSAVVLLVLGALLLERRRREVPDLA